MNVTTRNLLIIIGSCVVSIVLSNTADLDKKELGALANVFYPPIVGIISILFYWVAVRIFRWNPTVIMIIACLFNIATGFKLRFFD